MLQLAVRDDVETSLTQSVAAMPMPGSSPSAQANVTKAETKKDGFTTATAPGVPVLLSVRLLAQAVSGAVMTYKMALHIYASHLCYAL